METYLFSQKYAQSSGRVHNATREKTLREENRFSFPFSPAFSRSLGESGQNSGRFSFLPVVAVFCNSMKLCFAFTSTTGGFISWKYLRAQAEVYVNCAGHHRFVNETRSIVKTSRLKELNAALVKISDVSADIDIR